jgi:hypothetical protein
MEWSGRAPAPPAVTLARGAKDKEQTARLQTGVHQAAGAVNCHVPGPISRLAILLASCTRCASNARDARARVVMSSPSFSAQYGRRGNIEQVALRGDCPKRNAPHLLERCDLICPDLPKGAVFILRKSPPLYTSTWVHPARSRSARARYCSTLALCKD